MRKVTPKPQKRKPAARPKPARRKAAPRRRQEEQGLGGLLHKVGSNLHELIDRVDDPILELLDRADDPVKKILYKLLCEDHASGQLIRETVEHGSGALTAALVPLLVSQFALTPAIALGVAGYVAKLLLDKGPDTLCQELAAELGMRKPRRAATASKPRARAKAKSTAQTRTRAAKKKPKEND